MAGSLVRRKIWDLMWSPLNATLETAQVSQCISQSWGIVVGNIENMLSSVTFIHRGLTSSVCHGVFFLVLKVFFPLVTLSWNVNYQCRLFVYSLVNQMTYGILTVVLFFLYLCSKWCLGSLVFVVSVYSQLRPRY